MATLNLNEKKIPSAENLRLLSSLILSLSSKQGAIENKLINNWVASTAYIKDESFVIYDELLYVCKISNADDTFDKNKWTCLSPTISEITKSDIEALVNLTPEQITNLQSLIDDTSISTTHTNSSSHIYMAIQDAIAECKDDTLKQIAKKVSGSYKIANTTADIVSADYIYLLSNGSNYDLYVLVDGTAKKVGDTNIDLSEYAKTTDLADYMKTADADSKFATITTVDGKINKTNVLTAKDNSATDEQVYSAKAINTELDGVIKKNDAFVYKKVSNIDCEEGSWIAQFIEAPTSENGTFPLNDEWQKIEQFKAQDFVHQICTLYTSSGKIKGMYVRFAWCNATKIENAVWSPWQKICTTKVANVPFTKLTLDSSIFTLINSDAGLGYSVCNGICIITCSGIGLVSVGSHIVTTNIPKPAGGYASNILQTGAGSSVPTTPVFLAVSNNTLTILSNTHTGAFWGTLTYPVAES